MRFLAVGGAAVGLDMDVGHDLAQGVAQPALDVAGDVVGAGNGEFAVNLDVQVHHAQVAVAAGAQVVEGFHAVGAGDDIGNLVLLVGRQRYPSPATANRIPITSTRERVLTR